MKSDYNRGLYKEYELLLSENEAIKAEYQLLKKEYQILQKMLKSQEKLEAKLIEAHTDRAELEKEILRLNGLLNIDSTNSGVPTSKTPLSKKKVIPNSRKKSGKKIGGQPGHPKKKLEAFADHEVTETEVHNPKACPH